ncbi:MerR family transcriptional regulator [Aquimarina sp. 2201CG5-10]|uniref:MerR family transcriptional regulator n=1 Tax=Aquimarina callyspongiae TaxID=3098150 RepID=UPI002AB57405|nr:MerR family transcriptional regulator [Aquimarina sp. 2201CG5-10]MDY8137744.1 MerR family transcriptional regulator [Aquimarina sp. 2201CG5-10]
MNNIKQNFSIKDLENLCGVKAHTIRIWEKRYELLTPDRTQTNIRTYNLKSLQKLLNVTYLVNSGYKISRISKLNEDEINEYVRRIVSDNSTKNQAINSFKIAMLNYDLNLFLNTYEHLLEKRTFRQVFCDVFIPLLNEVGMLWQTDTINPSHEHFISNLIKQKLLVNIEKVQFIKPTKTDKAFILYLPENEIHELGLLFINYEILLRGYKAIYLGASIPLDSLPSMLDFHQNTIFVSYFTVKPEKERVTDYAKEFNKLVCTHKISEFWMLGKQTINISKNSAPNHRYFDSISDLITEL